MFDEGIYFNSIFGHLFSFYSITLGFFLIELFVFYNKLNILKDRPQKPTPMTSKRLLLLFLMYKIAYRWAMYFPKALKIEDRQPKLNY